MSTHISDDVRDFVSTYCRIDGDYMIEPPYIRRNDVRQDATYITVKGGKIVYRYQSLWCGDSIEGETYRQHRNGKRFKYPKRLTIRHFFRREEWHKSVLSKHPDLTTDDILEFFP